LRGIWHRGWGAREALRHTLAALSLVAALSAAFPPISSARANIADVTSGVPTADVNRSAVEPKAPRLQDVSAPAQPGDKLGPTPQPVSILDRGEQPIDAAPRPIFTTRATSLVAARATIAAQPRAPPLSRT